MPIVRRDQLKQEEPDTSVRFAELVGDQLGAGYVTMSEVTIAPGKSTSLHFHPVHEEAIYVMDSDLEFELGNDNGILHKGDALLAPAKVPHRLANPGALPAACSPSSRPPT